MPPYSHTTTKPSRPPPPKGQKYAHHVPRDVQSTLLRLITGHAFIYLLEFKCPNLPPATEREVACVCSAVPEDTEHVLLHCPLTHHRRHRHLFTQGLPRKVFDHPMRCLNPPAIPRSHPSLRQIADHLGTSMTGQMYNFYWRRTPEQGLSFHSRPNCQVLYNPCTLAIKNPLASRLHSATHNLMCT